VPCDDRVRQEIAQAARVMVMARRNRVEETSAGHRGLFALEQPEPGLRQFPVVRRAAAADRRQRPAANEPFVPQLVQPSPEQSLVREGRGEGLALFEELLGGERMPVDRREELDVSGRDLPAEHSRWHKRRLSVA
jgi:hypothetical protein